MILSRSSTILLLHCLYFLVLASSSMKYCNWKTFPNPSKFTKAVFTTNTSQLLLYGENKTSSTVYQIDSWVEDTYEIYTTFSFGPSYIEAFVDKYDPYQIDWLYANSEGFLRRKSIMSHANAYITYELYNVTDKLTDIQKISPSSDGYLYAAFSQGADKVYISGALFPSRGIVGIVDLSKYGPVTAIRWKPGSRQLFISGGKDLGSRYLLCYNNETKQTEDWSFLIQGLVVDIAFSGDSTHLYFVESSTSDYQIIWYFNFDTKEKSQFARLSSQQIINSIEVKGDYFSAKSANHEHIWELKTGVSMGSYQSKLMRSGLSPKGQYLVTISQNTSLFEVMKPCENDENHLKKEEFIS